MSYNAGEVERTPDSKYDYFTLLEVADDPIDDLMVFHKDDNSHLATAGRTEQVSIS